MLTMKKIDLSRFQANFISAVWSYREKNNLFQKQLAKIIGIYEPHLSNLMKYKRKLSAHYLLPFLQKGVVKMKEIWPAGDPPRTIRESDFYNLAKIIENTELQKKILKAQKLGVDVELFLDGLIAGKQNSKS